MSAILPLNITQDDLPEEAEAFLLRLIPQSVQGGAEVDEPMEVIENDCAGFIRGSTLCLNLNEGTVV